MQFSRSTFGLLGLSTYVLGGPIVHFAHGNAGKGFASLGLRVGAPLRVARSQISPTLGVSREAHGAGARAMLGLAGTF